MDRRWVRVGTPEFACGGVLPADLRAWADAQRAAGRTAVVVAVDGVAEGVIAVADAVLADAAPSVARLRALGIEPVMASGDDASVAQRVAAEVGIDRHRGGMLPLAKAALVEELRASGRRTAMVGDGVNHAPALLAADVRIAVGGGADIAADAADVVLMKPGVSMLVDAVTIARATMRTVRQNLWWAFGYNVVGIPLAAGVLWPVFHWVPAPMPATLPLPQRLDVHFDFDRSAIKSDGGSIVRMGPAPRLGALSHATSAEDAKAATAAYRCVLCVSPLMCGLSSVGESGLVE